MKKQHTPTNTVHFLALFIAPLLLTASVSMPALADDWHHHDIHEFHEHGFDHWRGGHWVNGFHEGHGGWWWIVDGTWYSYAAPVYPYPDPYTPPSVVVEEAPSGIQAYYYCPSPAGYYPYVPHCHVGWQRVVSAPTTPPPAQVIVSPPQAAMESPHDADMRQLNVFAVELQSIDVRNPHANSSLHELDQHVEAFRKSLFQRDYNAMDILRDSEDLKKRISEKRKAVARAKQTTPSLNLVPPGSSVNFPPQ